jgi:DNA-binding transcriptional regulator YbjK
VTERGERRRRELVDAAAGVLEQGGFAAVTHRSVAARAGLPLAATTYYFASLDDLLEPALGLLARRQLDRAAELAAEVPAAPLAPDALAARLVAMVAGEPAPAGPAGMLLFYERYLQAGRRPRLRPLVAAWNQELTGLLGGVLRRTGYPGHGEMPRALLAAVDGLLIDLLVTGAPDAPARAATALAGLLAALRPAPPA